MKSSFPELNALPDIESDVVFITAQELEDMYPLLSPNERENEFACIHKTVFITQIGGVLKSGIKHSERSPDYDDWCLNGDLLFYNDLLDCAIELSSMGVRVDPATLDSQLKIAGCDDRRGLYYHKMLLNGELPLTIGGGIGQSRLCMLLLGKAHIGETQVSVWDNATLEKCADIGINLL